MLVHPGGPFWAKKDEGAWSIPRASSMKAKTSSPPPSANFSKRPAWQLMGEFLDLGAHKQPSGKTIAAWACEGDFDPER